MKKYFIVLIIVLSGSCEKKVDGIISGEKIPIDLDKSENGTVVWKDHFSNIELIPLQTTSESLINKISKIEKTDSSYLIFDGGQSIVFIYNHQGKYLDKIDYIGRGPGEYGSIYDMLISPYTGNIELLSPGGEIFIYTKNGQWVKTISLPDIQSVHHFELLSDDIILLYSRDYRLINNIYFYSRSEKNIINKMKIPPSVFERNDMMVIRKPFVKVGDEVYIYKAFTNKVYSIVSDGYKLQYIWDFGKYNFDNDLLEKNASQKYYMEFFSKNTNDMFISFSTYRENKSHIILQLPFRRDRITIIYNKGNGSYKIMKGAFPTNSLQLLNDGFITSSSPRSLPAYFQVDQLNEDNKRLMAEVQPEDNPVLVRYYY